MAGEDPTRRHGPSDPVPDFRVLAAGEGGRWQLVECPRCFAVLDPADRQKHWTERAEAEREQDESTAAWWAFREAWIPGGE